LSGKPAASRAGVEAQEQVTGAGVHEMEIAPANRGG
jgi:hypothetical protein